MKKSDLLMMQVKVTRKLLGAIAMLLVSTIMLGTSTYAWRVMSTAPEITHITTTMGGNGYLEIALQSTDPATQRRAEITGGRAGQSVAAGKSALEANTHCEVLSVFLLGLVTLILSGFVPYFVPSGEKSFRQSNRPLLAGQPLLC